jgi:hypothetical protein
MIGEEKGLQRNAETLGRPQQSSCRFGFVQLPCPLVASLRRVDCNLPMTEKFLFSRLIVLPICLSTRPGLPINYRVGVLHFVDSIPRTGYELVADSLTCRCLGQLPLKPLS